MLPPRPSAFLLVQPVPSEPPAIDFADSARHPRPSLRLTLTSRRRRWTVQLARLASRQRIEERVSTPTSHEDIAMMIQSAPREHPDRQRTRRADSALVVWILQASMDLIWRNSMRHRS